MAAGWKRLAAMLDGYTIATAAISPDPQNV